MHQTFCFSQGTALAVFQKVSRVLIRVAARVECGELQIAWLLEISPTFNFVEISRKSSTGLICYIICVVFSNNGVLQKDLEDSTGLLIDGTPTLGSER
jgi:hypothetical protein